MRYVVVVKPPDDHPGVVRVFGPYAKDEAESFAQFVTDKVEAMEDDDFSGWAYVKPLEKLGRRNAAQWAMRGERVSS
jgi:hypothetical protein